MWLSYGRIVLEIENCWSVTGGELWSPVLTSDALTDHLTTSTSTLLLSISTHKGQTTSCTGAGTGRMLGRIQRIKTINDCNTIT